MSKCFLAINLCLCKYMDELCFRAVEKLCADVDDARSPGETQESTPQTVCSRCCTQRPMYCSSQPHDRSQRRNWSSMSGWFGLVPDAEKGLHPPLKALEHITSPSNELPNTTSVDCWGKLAVLSSTCDDIPCLDHASTSLNMKKMLCRAHNCVRTLPHDPIQLCLFAVQI